MAPQTEQPSGIPSEPSRTTGASFHAPLAESNQQHRDQLVIRDAAIAGTEYMAQNTHLKNVPKTWHRNNRQQHAIGCE